MSDTPATLNISVPATMDLLLSRRSGSAKAMKGPGPDAGQLNRILTAGIRVPDHGKLAPWRFIVFEGEGAKGPIASKLDTARLDAIKKAANLKSGDAIFFSADKPAKAAQLAGLARTRVGVSSVQLRILRIDDG